MGREQKRDGLGLEECKRLRGHPLEQGLRVLCGGHSEM